VLTDEENGGGPVVVVVVVELVAAAAVVVLTGAFAVVGALGVVPHPANATSPTDAATSAVRRPKTFTSGSVGGDRAGAELCGP
jgi:hypothetical protein